MRTPGDKNNIREELNGKTGMISEYEDQLFEDIAELEKDTDIIPGMRKCDWISMAAMTVAAIIMTLIGLYWAN